MAPTKRLDGRAADQLRPVQITPNFQLFPAGSVLIEFGRTRVICAASVEERVPPFMAGSGKGWVTAEYSMLPSATPTRSSRETSGSKPQGRTMEIQRLIGRSLRAVVNPHALGERTIAIDCDVIEADGGTRTASITGAVVALALAVRKLQAQGTIPTGSAPVLKQLLAAVSVGIVNGVPMLDLNYQEDSQADADCNVVMTDAGWLVEIQATAERKAFSRDELDRLLALATSGCNQLIRLQREVLGF
ncbi:MAG TPA: ribonuclease PH [Chloroflexia bacterium]|jgi:ribonuclease PH|nr:ribonuclease PH [Chloroflexia bacterium]